MIYSLISFPLSCGYDDHTHYSYYTPKTSGVKKKRKKTYKSTFTGQNSQINSEIPHKRINVLYGQCRRCVRACVAVDTDRPTNKQQSSTGKLRTHSVDIKT